MKKSFLLGMNNGFSINANRWGFGITGLIFLANGLLNLITRPGSLSIIIGLLMTFSSLFYFGYLFLALFEKSKYALKIMLTEEEVSIKTTIFKPSIRILWTKIKQIKLAPYQLDFELEAEHLNFKINTNPDTSIEIKKSLRQVAEEKNIAVSGG